MLRWHQELHRREAMTSYSMKQLKPFGSERGEPTPLCDVLQMCLCSIGWVRGYVNVFSVCVCVQAARGGAEPCGWESQEGDSWGGSASGWGQSKEVRPKFSHWTHSNTLWAVQKIFNFQQSLLCSVGSRDGQRDFSIEMETEEEWEALSLNPNQPLITRKVYFYSLSLGNNDCHHLLIHL